MLKLLVASTTTTRFIINLSQRFLYPFAPALSRGLGLPIPAITSLIALSQVAGLLSPLFGPLGDRWGYRRMMLLAVGVLVIAMLLVFGNPVYAVVALGAFCSGLSKSVFDPALQAYVGQRVSYQRRGTVIGLIELSWAGSTLIGIPLIGLLIDRLGWRSPFLVLGLAAALCWGWLFRVIQPDHAGSITRINPLSNWRKLLQSRAALGMVAFAFMLGLANDTVFVVYGVWFESSFGLSVVGLGFATIVIGLAELSGELLTVTLADRLGLKRAVTLGLILSIPGYLLLPILGQTLPLALVALFLALLFFEFTVVSTFPLATEVLPVARATMMSVFLAMTSLGRMSGAILGGLLWQWGEMPLVGAAAATTMAIALVVFQWGLRRW
jgi:predicted MFS family arabinose efflux permease